VVAKTVTINREPIAIIVLTRDGKSLLDAHQERAENGRRQEFTPAWSSLVSWRTTPNSIVSFRPKPPGSKLRGPHSDNGVPFAPAHARTRSANSRCGGFGLALSSSGRNRPSRAERPA